MFDVYEIRTFVTAKSSKTEGFWELENAVHFLKFVEFCMHVKNLRFFTVENL